MYHIHTIDGHWMTEITHGNKFIRDRNEHMEIKLSKQKKIGSSIYQISVIHLLNRELTPETNPLSYHAADNRQYLFEFHATYFPSLHFS
jgi:hypothetical protein